MPRLPPVTRSTGWDAPMTILRLRRRYWPAERRLRRARMLKVSTAPEKAMAK
jgi:hypothetical protein